MHNGSVHTAANIGHQLTGRYKHWTARIQGLHCRFPRDQAVDKEE